MERFRSVFGNKKPVIAMIHVDALPGTPKSTGSVREIIDKAVKEAAIYREAGVDSVMIENMHDVPYMRGKVGPEIVASMSTVALQVKQALGPIPCGIQVLAGANREAIAIAHAADLDFVRCEGFVFAHVADEGIFESCAGDILRYRKAIGADRVQVFTDVKKKHSSHAITADVNIAETAKAAEYFLSDGVIVTGVSTGALADLQEISSCKRACKIPVLVGSGVAQKNVEDYLKASDGVIIGSDLKIDGNWAKGVDPARTRAFMDHVRALRAAGAV
eukprot:tig00020537_g10256.t1